jgi:HSP20 family protein
MSILKAPELQLRRFLPMQATPSDTGTTVLLARRERPEETPEVQIYLRPHATLLRIDETVWHPPTDVFESEDAYHIKVELGGMERREIEVVLDDITLAIRGRRIDTSPPNKIRYRQAEIKYGRFEVRLALPADVDLDAIEAVYRNGFLDVTLPKKAISAHVPRKTIIQIG